MNMDKINISGDVTLHLKVNFEQPMVKKVPAMNTDTKTIDDDKPGPGRPQKKTTMTMIRIPIRSLALAKMAKMEMMTKVVDDVV